MPDFDILADVGQKFTGTIVMYNNKAHYVKDVGSDPNDLTKFALQAKQFNSNALKAIDVNDPSLNYKNYNIGYTNGHGVATWWFRKPQKQWCQGLKQNQMGWYMSNPHAQPYDGFGFTKPFVMMLENNYPNFIKCKESLIAGDHLSLAFHRDFAISYDAFHEDFIIEYRGTKVGLNLKDINPLQVKLKPEFEYLSEALKEVLNVFK